MLRWTPHRAVPGPITSTTNPLVKEVVRLHRTKERRTTGLVLIEGPQLLAEAVSTGYSVEFAFTTDIAAYPDAVEVSDAVLGKASTTATPNSLVAVLRMVAPEARPAANVLVLWDVAEPGNVGALIRSAAAFGFDVIVSGAGADPWSPKALRAGAGGHFHTRVRLAPSLEVAQLHELGFHTVAAVAHGGEALVGPRTPIALLVGSEAHGLPAEVVATASARWTIPTSGVESLNAAVAGSIAMYALSACVPQ